MAGTILVSVVIGFATYYRFVQIEFAILVVIMLVSDLVGRIYSCGPLFILEGVSAMILAGVVIRRYLVSRALLSDKEPD
jgi:hypothetical protein